MLYGWTDNDDEQARDYSNPNINLLAGLKFARTIITNKDGTITTARINLETGEIKPFNYSKSAPMIKAIAKKKHIITDYSAKGNLLAEEPFWVAYIDTNSDVEGTDKNITQYRKNKQNPNNVYLQDYMHINDAIEDNPKLEDMITGISNLDCGNDKPLNTSLLFNMLRDLDEVNQDTIESYTGFSKAYSRRLAQYLRVLVNAFDGHIEL